jgi:hypothetical protein
MGLATPRHALEVREASSPRRRSRCAFGVLAPEAWSSAGGCEPWWREAQILVPARASIGAALTFFQIERREIEDRRGRVVASLATPDAAPVSSDEGVLCSVEIEPADVSRAVRFVFDASRSVEVRAEGAVRRTRRAISGQVLVRREELDGERARLTFRVENTTPWSDLRAPRDRVMLGAMASTHVVISTQGGELLSLLESPDTARAASPRGR